MRSSRVSRDAAKLAGAMAASSSQASAVPEPPRRSSRIISLAQFAYTAPQPATTTAITSVNASASIPVTRQARGVKKEEKDDDNGVGDIEDVVGGPRKKRRVDTVVSERTSSRRRVVVKKDDDDDGRSVMIKDAIADEIKDELNEAKTEDDVPTPRRKARKSTTTTTTTTRLSTTMVQPPPHWQEIYSLVQKMRSPGGAAHNAPVDTMGCERLADPSCPPRVQRFHTLVALMLSSQTKDTVTAVVVRRLQAELPAAPTSGTGTTSDGTTSDAGERGQQGLTLENILAVPDALLNEFIWPVGFHNNKTRYLKRTAEILRDSWDGDIPSTIPGLTSLPGVGPKMAYLCLSAAWGRTEGIGVDVHVHRITNLWGWNGSKATKNPEETRAALEAWLPREKWREINALLVGLGQSVCLPVGRKCGECEVGLEGLCKSAERGKVNEGLRRRKREKLMEGEGEREVKEEREEVKDEEEEEEEEEVKEEEEEEEERKVDIVRVKKEDD